jgi:hypothetical protein
VKRKMRAFRRGSKRGSGCPSGKRRYPSQHEATVALASARISAGNGDSRRAENRTYECGRCNGGWHLTSAVPSQAP